MERFNTIKLLSCVLDSNVRNAYLESDGNLFWQAIILNLWFWKIICLQICHNST